MLNHSANNSRRTETASSAGPDDAQEQLQPAFVCVSSALRRLVVQAEIALPQLNFASIDGEPGSGKHLFAHTTHLQTPLASLPFLRCDAREWLASDSNPDHWKGTLYLDRVDLLGSHGQNLLLSVVKLLQDAPPPNFRLIASSHHSLRTLASYGQFLPDLAFRLAAVRFSIPALRDHREDIVPITKSLMDRICRHYRQPTAVLSAGVLPRLLQHNWPGNVRELASILENAVLNSPSGIIRAASLELDSEPQPKLNPDHPTGNSSHPFHPRPPLPDPIQDETDLLLDKVIQRHIQKVLDLNRGNKLRASRQLGISRSTLYRLLDQHKSS